MSSGPGLGPTCEPPFLPQEGRGGQRGRGHTRRLEAGQQLSDLTQPRRGAGEAAGAHSAARPGAAAGPAPRARQWAPGTSSAPRRRAGESSAEGQLTCGSVWPRGGGRKEPWHAEGGQNGHRAPQKVPPATLPRTLRPVAAMAALQSERQSSGSSCCRRACMDTQARGRLSHSSPHPLHRGPGHP